MHTKKIYYVSHPFTGDEEKNRRKAREITAELKKAYPKFIFINPLDVFQYTELVKAWNYEDILKQCLELLQICDGLILTGDWQESRGCRAEKQEAEGKGLEIYQLYAIVTDPVVYFIVPESNEWSLKHE